MGLISTTLASAISTGGALYAAPVTFPTDQPKEYTLLSSSMPLDRLLIKLTVQNFEISPELGDVIHSAILRGFEHQYHI